MSRTTRFPFIEWFRKIIKGEVSIKEFSKLEAKDLEPKTEIVKHRWPLNTLKPGEKPVCLICGRLDGTCLGKEYHKNVFKRIDSDR